MFNNKFLTALKSFFLNKRNIIVIYFIVAIVDAILKYQKNSINNYLIFKNVFNHFVNSTNLYSEYPEEYFDSNHYGPFFSIIIAPFALIPDWLGCIMWNVFNVTVLLYAIFKLPVNKNYQIIIALICINEVSTALVSYQFNVAITGMLLLTFIFLEKNKLFLASITIVISTLTKLYGVIGFAFFFFIKNKPKFILIFLLVLTTLFFLPSFLSSSSFLLQSYLDWKTSLLEKANINTTNFMADISFFGLINAWFGIKINVLYGLIIGSSVLGIALLRKNQYEYLTYRLLILCNTLLCIVLFNTNVESPTFVIAFFGIAIWYVIVPKTKYVNFLLIFAIVLTSLSATDLFPSIIRNLYIKPLKLKVLPCIFIYIDISYRLIKHEFSTYSDNKQLIMNEIENNSNLKNWDVFWQKSPDGFNDIMQKSTAYVGKKLVDLKIINKTNKILDFGCGPGFLIDCIKENAQTIVGVDISAAYIDFCKNKFKHYNNLCFNFIKPYDLQKLSEIIINEKIDTVLILSTLQYYNDDQDVKDLIISLKKASNNQKFRCIIADIIPKKHSFVADVKDLMFYAIKKRFFNTLFKFILYTFNSDYNKYKKKGLLELNYSFFEKTALENNIAITKMQQITIHSKRYSICLDF